MKIELAKTEIIHFIGIGGIGMSGLALIMKSMSFNVQGSDVIIGKNIVVTGSHGKTTTTSLLAAIGL